MKVNINKYNPVELSSVNPRLKQVCDDLDESLLYTRDHRGTSRFPSCYQRLDTSQETDPGRRIVMFNQTDQQEAPSVQKTKEIKTME